jgi:hypothetical protein
MEIQDNLSGKGRRLEMNRKKTPKYLLAALLLLLIILGSAAGCGSAGEPTLPNQGGSGQEGDSEPAGTAGNEGGEPAAGQGPAGEQATAEGLEEGGAGEFPPYTFASDTLHYKGYNDAADALEDHEYVIPAGTATTLKTVLDGYNAVYMQPVFGRLIEANSISRDGSRLDIDFSRSIYGNYGSGTEIYLLENLFRGYFENVPELEGISITVEGKAYETGHMEIEPGQVISRDEVMPEG